MPNTQTLGVILAGGKSSRMGCPDKFFLPYRGKSLIQHVIDLAKPQVNDLMICTNGCTERFPDPHYTIIKDSQGEYCGPLAGIISTIAWARVHRPACAWIASFPADTPIFPANLVSKLRDQVESNHRSAAFATYDDEKHYIFSLWASALLEPLQREYLLGNTSLKHCLSKFAALSVDFPVSEGQFVNINTPSDWQRLPGGTPNSCL